VLIHGDFRNYKVVHRLHRHLLESGLPHKDHIARFNADLMTVELACDIQYMWWEPFHQRALCVFVSVIYKPHKTCLCCFLASPSTFVSLWGNPQFLHADNCRCRNWNSRSESWLYLSLQIPQTLSKCLCFGLCNLASASVAGSRPLPRNIRPTILWGPPHLQVEASRVTNFLLESTAVWWKKRLMGKWLSPPHSFVAEFSSALFSN